MQAILSSIVEYAVAFVVIFVVLFLAVSYFFTGKKLLDTIRGFVLVIASLFYSPFKYFQKSLLAVAHFHLKDASETEAAKQYLLLRFLTALQALLAIIVIAFFTSGLIGAWNAFLPPKYAREENSRLEKALDNLNAEYLKLNPEVTKMEDDWTNRKQELIDSYLKEQESKAKKATDDNSSLETQISNAGGAQYLIPIKRYLEQNQYQSSTRRYGNIKNEALDYMKNQDTPSESKQLISRYIENWYVAATAKHEQSNLNEKEFRTRIQPEYSSKKSELSNVENQMSYAKEQQREIQPALQYNTATFFLLLAGTVLSTLLIIWIVGLTIELLWLSVDIAGNVNKIRTLKQNP